ncbi:hypothetical protein ACHAWF_006717 [Thalassiosira exigua]
MQRSTIGVLEDDAIPRRDLEGPGSLPPRRPCLRRRRRRRSAQHRLRPHVRPRSPPPPPPPHPTCRSALSTALPSTPRPYRSAGHRKARQGAAATMVTHHSWGVL